MATKPDVHTKARAVAELMAGETVAAVAQRYNVSRMSVQRWRDKAMVAPNAIPEDEQAEIGSLILRYTRTTVETLIAQAELARRPEWFDKQSAEHIAIWAGVHVDKITRIMAAFQRVDTGNGPAGAAGAES